MIPIRCTKAPAADSYGHEWPDTDTVVEVEHDEAHDLLSIPDGGFVEAEKQATKHPPAKAPAGGKRTPVSE